MWYIPVTSRLFPRCFYGSTENVSLLAVGTWFGVAALFKREKTNVSRQLLGIRMCILCSSKTEKS